MRSSSVELPIVERARLRRAPLRDADAEAVWLLTNDPAITTRVDVLPPPFAIAHAKSLIQSGKEDGRVGFLGAWDRQRVSGTGYAAETAAAVVVALGRMPPDRQVVAECRSENKASLRVLEKLGFRSTGQPSHRKGRERLTLQRMRLSDRT
jgi:hypothetical protein